MPYIGQVKLVPYSFAPRGYADCDGQLLSISSHTALFSILGTTYGGDGQQSFGLPDLQDRAPVHQSQEDPLGHKGGAANVTLDVSTMAQHSHAINARNVPATETAISGNVFAAQAQRGAQHYITAGGQTADMSEHGLTETGGGQAHDNTQPSMTLRYVVALEGTYPSRDGGGAIDDQDYIGEIRPFGFNFAPRGWAQCDGQLLAIASNQALFSLLGTVFGGDGKTTFALPDLRGRTAVGLGQTMGAKFGSETVTLNADQIPAHDHQTELGVGVPDVGDPSGAMIANEGGIQNDGPYDVKFHPGTVSNPNPNSQPHNNMMPYQTVNFCICLFGLFPSRN